MQLLFECGFYTQLYGTQPHVITLHLILDVMLSLLIHDWQFLSLCFSPSESNLAAVLPLAHEYQMTTVIDQAQIFIISNFPKTFWAKADICCSPSFEKITWKLFHLVFPKYEDPKLAKSLTNCRHSEWWVITLCLLSISCHFNLDRVTEVLHDLLLFKKVPKERLSFNYRVGRVEARSISESSETPTAMDSKADRSPLFTVGARTTHPTLASKRKPQLKRAGYAGPWSYWAISSSQPYKCLELEDQLRVATSFINLLEREALFFRNVGQDNDEFELPPV